MDITRTTESMTTADGVRLDADVWRPPGAGPFPVLLMRQPYGRQIASTIVYAHPSWYAAQGFIVVIQDVRGRGTSEGTWRLLEAEQRDGAETVAWAAGLPGSNGAVGMYGFSYQGMTQLLAAAAKPPALKAIAPAMAAWEVREDFAYEGDAFRLQAGLGWGCQLALETVRRMGDGALHQSILAAARGLPLGAEIPARPPIAAAIGQHGHYLDWLTEPAGADYWRRISPAAAGPIDIPALHVGGWYDPLLRGTLGAWRALSAGTAPQRLIIGPWVHIPWSRHVGALDFGPDAATDIDRQQVAWFKHWLGGGPLPPGPPISLFEMGGTWRGLHSWPTAGAEWPITSTGLAGMREDDGRFGEAAGGSDVFVYDPWRPTPSIGGHAGHPAGPLDRTQADARSDVLTYTTDPLETDLHLAGDVTARLAIAADAPSFDVHAILSELPATGGVYEITSGHRRIDSPVSPVTVEMRATCIRIPAGSRLRLSVAAGAFPAFAVNSGTGKPPAEERLIEQRIITLVLHHAGSDLILPVA